MRPKTTGGGWAAIRYSLRLMRRAGWRNAWRALNSRNACKTCALGMGGQKGGMVNEGGHWPEVCKKSFQAMAADMQSGLKPEFFARYSLAELRTLSPRELESAGRLAFPLLAGPGDAHYRPIEWEVALDMAAAKLRAADPRRAFFYSSGRSSNEAGFLLQLFARCYGTNHVNNCSYYCHQASGVGLASTLGVGTATVSLEDLDHSDLFLLIGGNPASNHPRLMRTMMQLRRRGGKVIVVNPVREIGLVNFSVPSDPWSLLFGTPIATKYVQPHVGGDLALLTAVAKVVLEKGAVDAAFIAAATEGFEAFKDAVAKLTWEELITSAGVARAEIDAIAADFIGAQNVVIGWTMGITHHRHGVENVRAIVALQLLRGMVGKPGAGLLPIRGHSNVQGIGSVGVTPALKDAVLKKLESDFGVRPPDWKGYDTLATMEAAERGEFDFGFCLGGNLFGSNPDANWATAAMKRIGLVVHCNTTLNTGHAWGLGRETLILPMLARDEEPQLTTQESMFNFVRVSDGGITRLEGPRAESAVLAQIATRVFAGRECPLDWAAMEKHGAIRNVIAKVIPGYEAIAEVDKTKQEFHVGGRIFHAAKFPTPSGKAIFHAPKLPERMHAADELLLMTVRSEGQFNTVVYEEEDIYRGQDRRDVILLSAEDMKRLGLKEDQPVTVKSAAGSMTGILARRFDIRAGAALMYYPEANVLVPRDADPLSRTPAFKAVPIKVFAASARDSAPLYAPAALAARA